jgi:hypothetical protein
LKIPKGLTQHENPDKFRVIFQEYQDTPDRIGDYIGRRHVTEAIDAIKTFLS